MLRDVHPIPNKVRWGHTCAALRSVHTCPRSETEWECRCGGTLRSCVFRHFAWLEVGSIKAALSRPTHQPSSVCYATGIPYPLNGTFGKAFGEGRTPLDSRQV